MEPHRVALACRMVSASAPAWTRIRDRVMDAATVSIALCDDRARDASQMSDIPVILTRVVIYSESTHSAQATAPATNKDHGILVVFLFKVCTPRASPCRRHLQDHDELMVFVFNPGHEALMNPP